LYKALKDLGRLYKTIYIYEYVDDEVIRKSVSGSLSKIESSNKFSKAITVGNNQELIWVDIPTKVPHDSALNDPIYSGAKYAS
jgi:TnpA family transposase